MIFFIIELIFELSQIFVNLLLVFFNYSRINVYNWDTKRLALSIMTQIRIVFYKPTQDMTCLISLTKLITTILITDKIIRGLLNLSVFLDFKITIYWLMAIMIISTVFSNQKKVLANYFGFNIYSLLNNFLFIR